MNDQKCPLCGILFYDDLPSHADDLLLIRTEGSCYVCQFEKWMEDKLAQIRAQNTKGEEND